MQLTPARTRARRAPGCALLLLCVSLAAARHARAQERPWTLSSDSSVYTDTDNVLVVTSQLGVAHTLGPDGGKVSATGVVDVVSAASVDVVAAASKRFHETRTEGNFAISHAFGSLLPSLNYRYSSEADYRSQGVGGGLQTRLGGADTVLGANYQLILDTAGRSGTPFSVFSRSLTTQSADIGITQNLSKRMILRGVYTLTVQDGYMAKVYRFVPLFDSAGLARAKADGAQLGLSNFSQYRLAARPPENVPDSRVRNALALRWLYYLESLEASVRADYRFYIDDWNLTANTLELSFYKTLSELFMLDLFTRGYQQSAASFYKSKYVVGQADEVPRFRTVDRKLSPYYMYTLGARIELHTEPITAYFELSGMYTRFTDYLFIDHEVALVGQGGIAWTP
ncbi:MAG TPA: DUF3570 domain-containing protein [Polyangiales bacterium]